jgi:hypothetical protein
MSLVHDEIVVTQVLAFDQHGVRQPRRDRLRDVSDVKPERAAAATASRMAGPVSPTRAFMRLNPVPPGTGSRDSSSQLS